MDTVNGLRSVNDPDTTIKRKKGRSLVKSRGTQERLAPKASPVDTFVSSGQAPDVSSNLLQLSKALGGLNPMLQRYANQQQISQEKQTKEQEKEQLKRVRYYTELFMKDKESGAVNQAQIKELFPELVPSVAARVAQATGEKEAKQWLSGRIQSILEDDELRLNTQAREAELQAIRDEALERIGDNEFYGAGFLNQMDRSLGEFTTAWMRETAAHHEDLQKESLANQVTHLLMTGGDLLQQDDDWKLTSSLSHQERNEVTVKAGITLALSTMDHTVLDRLPDRFLNAETKAEIAKAKMDINNGLYTQYVQKQRLEDDARKTVIRQGQKNILDDLATGKDISPLDYRETPELYQFANQMANQPRVNPVKSNAEARRLRTAIMMGGTTGDFTGAIGGDFALRVDNEQVMEQTLIDWVAIAPNLNPSEKTQLIKDIPTLLSGVNFIRDPDFSTYFEDSVGTDARVFAESARGETLSIASVNVLGEVRKAYTTYVRQAVMQHIEEHNEIPRNRMEIMEKAAEAASKRLEFIQKNASRLSKERFSGKQGGDTSGAGTGGASGESGSPFDDDGNLVLPDGQKIRVRKQ